MMKKGFLMKAFIYAVVLVIAFISFTNVSGILKRDNSCEETIKRLTKLTRQHLIVKQPSRTSVPIPQQPADNITSTVSSVSPHDEEFNFNKNIDAHLNNDIVEYVVELSDVSEDMTEFDRVINSFASADPPRNEIKTDHQQRKKNGIQFHGVVVGNSSNLPDMSMFSRNFFNRSGAHEFRCSLLDFIDIGANISLTKKSVTATKKMKVNTVKHMVEEDFYHILPSDRLYHQGTKFPVCAVVGNSGILNGSHCGAEINNASFVFRSNLAPLKGHAKDVGKKSNFTTMNPSVLEIYYSKLKSIWGIRHFRERLMESKGGVLWVPALLSQRSYYLTRAFVRLFRHRPPPVQFAVPPHDISTTLRGFWQQHYNLSETRLTSGLLLLSFAIGLCDEVHVYGFYPFNVGPNGEPITFHYYNEPTDYDNNRGVHHFNEEFNILQSLHRQGIVVVKLKCGSQV